MALKKIKEINENTEEKKLKENYFNQNLTNFF